MAPPGPMRAAASAPGRSGVTGWAAAPPPAAWRPRASPPASASGPAKRLARGRAHDYLGCAVVRGISKMIVPIIIVIVIVALMVMVIGTYNRLVALRQKANEAFADIDVQLKQRSDLIPNLVETVKGYAAHERGTLDEVTAARAQAASASTVEGKVQAENALTGALGRLFAVAEAYPDLKANQNFLQLQGELTDIENKLAAARARR